MNARKSGHERTNIQMNARLDMNARKSGESTKVWALTISVWDGLDIDTFRLGRSGHIDSWSGTSTGVFISRGLHLSYFYISYNSKQQLGLLCISGAFQWIIMKNFLGLFFWEKQCIAAHFVHNF